MWHFVYFYFDKIFPLFMLKINDFFIHHSCWITTLIQIISLIFFFPSWEKYNCHTFSLKWTCKSLFFSWKNIVKLGLFPLKYGFPDVLKISPKEKKKQLHSHKILTSFTVLVEQFWILHIKFSFSFLDRLEHLTWVSQHTDFLGGGGHILKTMFSQIIK